MATAAPSPNQPSSSADSAAADIAQRDSHQLRRGRLGVLGITFFVISAAAPLTAMAGGAPVAMLLGDGAGVPFAYVIVAALLLIFAVGYTTMARHHTSSGAFYAYVTRGLGQYAGGAAAFIALLGYNAMQIGLIGLFGAAASSFFSPFGIGLPWWAYAFVAIALIGVCGYRQVDLSMRVLGVLVTLEFLIVVALDVAIVVKGGHGGGTGLTFASFTPAALLSGSLAIALLFNSASFIGFEATTIYSEEAKDPRRTVPRATYLAVCIIGVFYTVTTWLMVNGQGADGLVAHIGGLGGDHPDPTLFLFELGGTYLGSFLTQVMSALFVSSVFAALLAFHNAVARYLFSLGREGLLPARVGHTHSVHLSPHIGSLSQTVLATVVVALFVLTHSDPVLALFTWLTQLGTLAVLVLMALASLAVVVFFARNRGLESNLFTSLVAPIVGTITMALVSGYAASQFGLLISNPGSPLAWGLPSLIIVAALAGVIAAAVLHGRSPALFANMGRNRSE